MCDGQAAVQSSKANPKLPKGLARLFVLVLYVSSPLAQAEPVLTNDILYLANDADVDADADAGAGAETGAEATCADVIRLAI